MKLILQFVLQPAFACIATGFLLAQAVLAMAERHQHRFQGFGFAAVCVLAAGAALVSFLHLLHVKRGGSPQSAPVNTWLIFLGLAFVMSVGWLQ